jgi:hypothetical protein
MAKSIAGTEISNFLDFAQFPVCKGSSQISKLEGKKSDNPTVSPHVRIEKSERGQKDGSKEMRSRIMITSRNTIPVSEARKKIVYIVPHRIKLLGIMARNLWCTSTWYA